MRPVHAPLDVVCRPQSVVVAVGLRTTVALVAGICLHAEATQGGQRDARRPSAAGVCPPFHLLDEEGQIIDPVANLNADKPYSPRKTCGSCHDYENITQGYHFTQGAGEKPTASQQKRCQWALSPGNYGGTWCSPAPLYRYLSPKSNTAARTMDMTSFSFVTSGCGACHPGGGPMEYDRAGKRYDRWMSDPASGFSPGAENSFDGDYYQARWSQTGVLEADCLICHLPEYDFDARNRQLKLLNFRWAPTVGAGLGKIAGSVKDGDRPQVTYDRSRFDADGNLSPHIIGEPRDRACLACHAKPGWKKRGANFRARTDVHIRAGVKCVDCHPAGSSASDPRICGREIHQIGKGDDPAGHVRDDLDNTCRSCADCHESGYLGAPIARHRWLPPLHLDKVACQTCHIPQRTVKAALVQASDVFNPGTKIPTKGKHLWTFYGPDMKYWNHYGDLEMMGYDDKPTEPFRPALASYKGKIHPVNRVHSTWPAILTEGQEGLMQPKMNDIYQMWKDHQADPSKYPELAKIKDDNGDGVPEVNAREEIDALIASVTEMLTATGYPMDGKRVVWVSDDRVYRSGTDHHMLPKQAWEASAYGNVHKYNHDVYPAKAALGSSGCTDCHHPASHFFFAQVVKYPCDASGVPVTEPQYRALGLNGTLVTMGAWRETYLKPVLYVGLLVLACALAGVAVRVALEAGSGNSGRRLPVRLASAMVTAAAGVAALWLLWKPDLREYMLPSRAWLDGNHAMLALTILGTGAAVVVVEARRGKPFSLVMLLLGMLLGAVSGAFMLFKPPLLETLNRISYTVFDGSLVIVVGGLILAGLAAVAGRPAAASVAHQG